MISLEHLNEAEAVCRQLTETQPRSPHGWRGLASVARQRGDRARSLEHWRKAFELEPGNGSVAVEISNDLRELGHLDEAEAVCRQLTETQPRSPHGWRGLASVARQRGNRARSLEHWRKAFELEPGNGGFAVEISNDLRELGHLDEAEAVCRQLTETQPRSPHGWRGLAHVARRRGDRARSLEHWRKAFELEPGNGGFAVEISNDLRELGRLDEAEAVCRQLTETQPRSPHGWRGLASVARQRGDRARSLEHWRKAFELEPGNGSVAVEISNDLRELGHLDEAEAVCRQLTQTQPRSPHGWRGLASVARQRGDRARSLEHWRKAFELEPGNGGFAVELSNDLRELGRLDEAEAVCRQLTETQPRSPHGWRGLAHVARRRGDRARSLEHWRKAFELEPGNGGFAAEMSNDLRELGVFDEAEAVAHSFSAAHPNSAQALINYANSIRRKISKSELVLLLERAVALEPENPGPWMTLASEYMTCWRVDDAETLYDRALVKNVSFVPALTGKGHVLRRRGDRLRAMTYFSRAAELNMDSEGATLEFARELIDAGMEDRGVALLQDVVARRENWSDCHLLLGQIARDKGNRELARKFFEASCAGSSAKGQAWIELTLDDFRRGDAIGAVERIHQIRQERPTYVRAIEVLAGFAQAMDDLEGALELLMIACHIDASKPHLLIAIANLQARLGRFEAMHASFAELTERFGDLPEAETTKGAILNQQGECRAARAVLEKAASAFPTHFGVWSALLSTYLAEGDFVSANTLFEACPAACAREYGRVSLLRAQMALRLWHLEEAAAQLESALKYLPADRGVNSLAVLCALLQADVETARRRLDAATDSDPHHRALRGGGRKTSQTHDGQLLDEYRLDASALGRLRSYSGGANPITSLARLVIETPDYAPSAIGLMVSLRRQGHLAKRPESSPAPSLIPRKIAQFWDDDVPPDVQCLCRSWQEIQPDFAYTLFSKLSARRFLMEKGAVSALIAFDRARESAMKADIFRLAYIFYEGGYYVDADDRCVARLDELDRDGSRLLLYQEDRGTVGNNFIGAVPGHPAIGLALNGAVEALNRGDSDIAWLATGPGLLTRAVARYLAEDLAQRLEKVRVLERHELAKFVAVHCMTSYKYSKKHWSRTSFHKRQKALFSVGDVGASVRAAGKAF